MTAEIAIMNREAIAMAADSAATVTAGSGQKVFSSAHKVFALSKQHPVGIMIYGNALFMNIPWEVIIKMHRRNLGSTRFNTLNEYAINFVEFLKGAHHLFPAQEQERYVRGCIYSFYLSIKTMLADEISERISAGDVLTDADVSIIFDQIVADALAHWKVGTTNIENPDAHRKEIKAKYKDAIQTAKSRVFENLPMTASTARKLTEIASYLPVTFSEKFEKQSVSGIVIGGFGEDDIFPSIVSFTVEGIANDVLKYKQVANESISFDRTALIYPFAQKEMVVTFINGISELFQSLYTDLLIETIDSYPKIILDAVAPKMAKSKRSKILDQIDEVGTENLQLGLDRIAEIQREFFIDPILSVVTFLAKNELAEMAESLVNLTCLRKKISMDDETVGGPIDVAVISKGDGLVWIKRKHYFEAGMNPDFFARI